MGDDAEVAEQTEYEIRRVRAEEWPQVKQLRLEALRDPVAHLAFLETLEEGLARPDELWQKRARDGAVSDRVCNVMAVAGDAPVGQVVVLITPAREADYMGTTADHPRAGLVGVYIRPEHRGAGLIGRLCDAAAAWAADHGIEALGLYVNEDNARAIAAYRKCGFDLTGGRYVTSHGVDLEMTRVTRRGSPRRAGRSSA